MALAFRPNCEKYDCEPPANCWPINFLIRSQSVTASPLTCLLSQRGGSVQPIKVFVVRIYRTLPDGGVVGVVENANRARSRKFSNADELWRALFPRAKVTGRSEKSKK